MTGEKKLQGSVLIVGAGPGGMATAQALAASGISVDIVDENPQPGGAISRKHFAEAQASSEVEFNDGLIKFHPRTICHGFDRRSPVLSQDGELLAAQPEAVVLAAGARERLRPIPGSLLRGALTCGGAQTLVKGSGQFPYPDAVVAGSGPLLLATASQLIDAGVRVHAVVEEIPVHRAPIALAMKVATSMPASVLRDGSKYMSNLLRHGVKILSGYRVERISGTGGVQRVSLRSTKAGDEQVVREFQCESVVLGYGFVSVTELAQQVGAEMEFDKVGRFWAPRRSSTFETSVEGVFAVGDCAGILGSDAAELEGAIAGQQIVQRLTGGVPSRTDAVRLLKRYQRVSKFQRNMNSLFPQVELADIDPNAIVCRCEKVRQRDVEEALAHGASDFRTVKLWTRLGMGICQGRTCHSVLGDQLSAGPGTEPPRVQFPVRPLPFKMASSLGNNPR